MHKTTLYLDEPTYERVRRMAEASDRTQAAIVREALAVYTGLKQKAPRSIGLGHSGRCDVSVRADEFLDGMGES